MAGGGPPWWGWHRLSSREAARLVADAGVGPGKLVIDVGAGDGVITAALVRAGASVLAVELHPGRAHRLRERFAFVPTVRVVRADAADLRLPHRPFCVVANPPFAITTALLRRLLSPASQLRTARILVPTQVAARWAAGRGPATALWEIRCAGRVAATAFRPPAPVPVAVLSVTRRRP